MSQAEETVLDSWKVSLCGKKYCSNATKAHNFHHTSNCMITVPFGIMFNFFLFHHANIDSFDLTEEECLKRL